MIDLKSLPIVKGRLAGVRIASEFAESGSGTVADPYINGPQEAHDDFGDWGKGIFYLDGLFEIYTPFVITKSLMVLGTSWSSHYPSGIQAGAVMDNLVECSDGTAKVYAGELRNLWLDGKDKVKNVILLNRTWDWRFHHIFTDGGNEADILVQYAHDCEIFHCYFYGTGDYNIKVYGPTKISRLNMLEVECANADVALYIGGAGVGYEIKAIHSSLGGSNEGVLVENCPHTLILDNNTISGAKDAAKSILKINPSASESVKCARIINNCIVATTGGSTGIEIKGDSDTINIRGNDMSDTELATKFDIGAGVNQNGLIKSNIGANPIGKITNPFDTTNDLIHLTGDAAAPAASTVYTVCLAPCRIISTDSGDTNCSIEVKDKDGNSIEAGLSTYDGWLEPGWTINWGAFTGVDPTVKVIFK